MPPRPLPPAPLPVCLPCAAVLAALGACAPADPDTSTDPRDKGTEIGDEGGEWPCAESIVPLTDPDVAPDGFALSPAAVAAALSGSHAGDGATLALAVDPADARLFDLEPAEVEDPPADWNEPDCVDFYLIGATVELDAPGASLGTDGGLVAVAVDGAAALGAEARLWEQTREDPEDDEGGDGADGGGDGADGGGEPAVAELDADPSSFTWEEMQVVDLVLEGAQAGGGLELRLYLRASSLPEGEDGTVRDLEEEVWAGAVEPG
jgi:hypothetical protein